MISSLLLALVLNAFGAVHTPAELPADRCEEDEVCWVGSAADDLRRLELHEGHWDVTFSDGRPGWTDFASREAAQRAVWASQEAEGVEVGISAACITSDPVLFPCAPGVTVQEVVR